MPLFNEQASLCAEPVLVAPHGAPVRHPHLFRGFGIRPRYHSKAYDLGYLLSMAFVETSPFDQFFAVFTAQKLTKNENFGSNFVNEKIRKNIFSLKLVNLG